MSKKQSKIKHENAEALHNRCKLDRRRIDRVMIRREQAHILDLASHRRDNYLAICEIDHTCFPVVDGADRGRIVGILYSRDFYDALLDTDNDPSRNLRPLCREPLVVAETQRVCEVFELMQLKCAHMALVIDEHGALAGIVTIDDLLSEDGGMVQDPATPST